MRRVGIIITIISVLIFGEALAYAMGVQAGIKHNTCHSTAEDSELYDCNFDGPSHSWTRK